MEKYDDLLNESKRTISKWEHEFQKTHGTRPSKEDFKFAPTAVTEAYKTYYKIKKKQEQINNEVSPRQVFAANLSDLQEKENDVVHKTPPASESVTVETKATGEPTSTPSKVSVWGEHLNKPNLSLESTTPKSAPSSASTSSYSKLTQKLMKGAKINIRSSLTRKLSSNNNKSLNASQNQLDTSSFGDSTFNEDLTNSSLQQSSLEESSLNVSNLFPAPDEETKEIIQGFKPKIVQNQFKIKPSINVRGMASKQQPTVTTRNVDLKWLDECLANGRIVNHEEPKTNDDNDDDDIAYSSDEEPKPRPQLTSAKKALKTNPPEVSQTVQAVKRKLEEEESEPAFKKSRVEHCEASILNDESLPKVKELIEDNTNYLNQQEDPSVNSSKKELSSTAAKRERLANKMASGTANQNFVRINLKKKTFVRGKKTLTGSKYKRQQWKQRQGGGGGGGKGNYMQNSACRRCGELGHWAKTCRGEKLLSLENMKEQGEEEEGLEFPTLEEALENGKEGPSKSKKKIKEVEKEPGDDDLQLVELPTVKVVEPVCSLGDPVPSSVTDLLKKFGHSSFRHGQEEVIMRILSGCSTLVVQSTGAGKSLCYQLPAVIYAQRSAAITIVISPLVSLMEDQVANLPSFVKAVCLHSGQTEGVRQKTLQALQSSTIHILLISPEAVTSTGPMGLVTLLRTCLPPVAFVCIDEAHCVSQWSHNFRPSYLRICKILRQKMNIQTILGLTATAPKSTLRSIAGHLGVDSESGVIRGVLLPLNLHLTVSRDPDRDAALVQLLQGGRFADFNSIIIYCIRREECERVATLLRTCLKDPVKDLGSKGAARRRGISWSAESYHAGLTPARRISIQKQFMSGKLRIVVATVAFGMGINKADIRTIIHYNAPKNFENYVQEIGRAGRDGLPAHCHVFLNSEGRDLQELRRFIYANSTDRHVLRKLVHKIIPETCECPSNEDGGCKGHEVAMVIQSTVQELDMPEENIATLICHLEAHPSRWVMDVGTHVYATCTVRCYGGLQQLKMAARDCPPLGVALALQKSDTTAVRTFAVVDVARRMGWDSGQVKRQLKSLEWDRSAVALGGKPRRSGIMIEFSDLAFHLHVRGNLTEAEQDEALEFLHQRCLQREASELQQLQRIHQALLSVSHSQSTSCCDEVDPVRTEKLRGFIRDYFEEATAPVVPEGSGQCPEGQESHIRSSIRNLILNYRDQTFTARSIARILHGISSPCYPAEVWGKAYKFWRAHLHQDFNLLVRLAAQELLALK